ncbi:hypothetical protein BDN72DRAFT_897128 [Pluteus cervinus]|uniref:Uncharacterized protein n=1 Tax=Pluteus cervinus TaxID=181527 RepID=A0ACD3AXD7_9AGAR|nr:hypothetical protein BDN72DRAFT_897128 [Pluteus cervinus]
MTTHTDGDAVVAVAVSRKRAAATNDSARPLKQSRRRKGKLHRLLELPYDILLEVLYQLDPYSLLRLSRASRDLRTFLMARASRHIWLAVLKNAGMPECPPGLSEPRYFRLVFDITCLECGVRRAKDVHWEAKTRCCKECASEIFTLWSLSSSLPYEVRSYVPSIFETTRPRGYRYDRRVINRYEEVHQSFADDVPLRDEWLAELKAQKEQYNTFVESIKKWTAARKEEQNQVRAEKRMARRLIIETKLRDLGWGSDLLAHCFNLPRKKEPAFHNALGHQRDLTDKVLESLLPDFESCLIAECEDQWRLLALELSAKGWSEEFVADSIQKAPLTARHSDPPCKYTYPRWRDVISICERYMDQRVIARLQADGWSESLARQCTRPDGSIVSQLLPTVANSETMPREDMLQTACEMHLNLVAGAQLRRKPQPLLDIIGVMLENSLGFLSLHRGHTISPSVADLVEHAPVLSAALAYADSLELPSHPGLDLLDELKFVPSTPWNQLLIPHFASLWTSWKTEKDSQLLRIAQRAVPTFSPSDLHLATTFFFCRSGAHLDEPIGYPRILSHACLTKPRTDSGQPEDAFHTQLGHVPWNLHQLLEYHQPANAIARVVILACGAHPDYMTAKDMSELNPVLECLACSSSTSERVFMNWRRAIIHGLKYHHETWPAVWRCLRSEERDALRSFANSSEGKHLQTFLHDRDVFLCKHCRFTNNFYKVYHHIMFNHVCGMSTEDIAPDPDSGYTPMEVRVPLAHRVAREMDGDQSLLGDGVGPTVLKASDYTMLSGERDFGIRGWEMSVYPPEEF